MTGDPARAPPILVVDDEALLRLPATDVLEDGGFRVMDAGDADEALALLTDHDDVRVRFTDINGPATSMASAWPRRSIGAGPT